MTDFEGANINDVMSSEGIIGPMAESKGWILGKIGLMWFWMGTLSAAML